MSFILSPALAVAPPPTATPNAPVAARDGDAGQNKPGSFGEALARSLAPAAEKTEKPATPPTAVPARRQAGKAAATPEEVTDALVISLMLPDGKSPLAAPAASAGSAAAPLAAAGKSLPGQAALPTDHAAASAVAADAAEPALDVDADTGLEVALQPVLTAAAGKSAGQAPSGPAGPAIAVDRPGSANPRNAADAGTGGQDPSPKRDGGQPGPTGASVAASAEPATVRSAAKAPSSSATPVLDATATVPGQASAAPTLSVGTALPLNTMNPLNVLPGPSGPLAPGAPAPVAIAALAPEVGSSEWGKALGQQVIHMGSAGQQVAELQLNPPGLGPLKVTLSMNEHQVQALFVSAHASVRAAVEAALPQLRSSLAESGISLGNTSVGADNQPQSAFADSQNEQPERGAYRADTGPELAGEAARPVAEPRRTLHGMQGTGVDTYA